MRIVRLLLVTVVPVVVALFVARLVLAGGGIPPYAVTAAALAYGTVAPIAVAVARRWAAWTVKGVT